MKFRRRRESRTGSATVELTPLIDVVLLLLIFFMVSTTFRSESVLAVELPDADGAPRERADVEVTVHVDADGRIAVDDRELVNGEVEVIAAALAAAAGERVVVAADAAARHDAVVRVLDAAGRAGLAEVRILTQRPPGGPGGPGGEADGRD